MSQSAWAQSQPQLRGSVESYTHLTPLHSCTSASLFSLLSCALDHPSNAFLLAQVVPQNRVAFDTLSPSLLSDSLSRSLSLPCSSLQLSQPHAVHNCSHHFSELLVLCTSPHHFSLHISQTQALRDSLYSNCNNCDLLLLLLPQLLTLHHTLFLQPLPCLYYKTATRISVPPHCSLHFLLKHSQLGRKASPS